jgi:hypothetical protein
MMFGSLLEQLAVWIVTGSSRPFHQTGEMDHKNKLLSTELLKNRSARMEATFLVVVIQQSATFLLGRSSMIILLLE